jgi:hypothetical protein
MAALRITCQLADIGNIISPLHRSGRRINLTDFTANNVVLAIPSSPNISKSLTIHLTIVPRHPSVRVKKERYSAVQSLSNI